MNTTDITAGRGLEALRAAIAGRVFVPGEAGYDQARRAWNLAVDQRPAVVVEAGSAADVARAVRFARAHGMRIAPQGTGHGAGPLEPLVGAMLLRTTRLRPVRIDPAARTARAEAGAVWQDVTVPAAQHGQVPRPARLVIAGLARDENPARDSRPQRLQAAAGSRVRDVHCFPSLFLSFFVYSGVFLAAAGQARDVAG